ncbi:hypothetical protein CK203_020812 [Vitis vinifera]|uniref:Uncharacterized protein n=1 Tax=Vitis vinifera TaxID=29760 RepID=A0A438IHK7_VITVI|nr:hypothetical protein CK203_020812 [Vitis vinifera]
MFTRRKSVDKLNVREFREHFCIPNGVSIQLVDGEAVSTEKFEDNIIFFTKEQFNAGLRFPFPSLFKEFLHFTQIPSAYIHPNMVWVLMGCSILSVLFDLDLSLLEVLFIYSIKKGKNDIHSFVASLPSLQLVTSLPDSTKGQRTRAGQGPMGGFDGKDRRGKVVEWMEKASFDRLNRLFEIAAGERSCETLLSAQNLRLVTQVPQSYVLNILPRRLPKKVVAGEHFVLKDLPFYAAVRKANAQARKALLNEREERRQEGTLRKAPGDKRSAPTPPAGATQRERRRSGSGRLAGLNGSGPSVPAFVRMALLAEEATSVCQLGSSLSDVDVVGASCVETLPPMAPPMEETGLKNRVCPLDRLLETIEVSCSSAQEDHPEGSETEMAEGNPTDPVLVPDEGGSPVDDAASISASPFSYAELGEMLKRIPPGVDVLVSGIRSMVQQRDLFSDLLRTADFMKAFVSQRINSEDELRLRLERVEASLSAAQRASEENAEALKKSRMTTRLS